MYNCIGDLHAQATEEVTTCYNGELKLTELLLKKVKTTTEEEKTVCWLTLHNLTVTDTGKR